MGSWVGLQCGMPACIVVRTEGWCKLQLAAQGAKSWLGYVLCDAFQCSAISPSAQVKHLCSAALGQH